MHERYRAIGLMSGTSMDGSVDAVLLHTDGRDYIEPIAYKAFQYEDASGARPFHHLMKPAELAVRTAEGRINRAETTYPTIARQYLAATFQLGADAADEKFATLSNAVLGHRRATLSELVEKSTDIHIAAVRQLLSRSSHPLVDVDVVGYHGQTLFHDPRRAQSVQVGQPQRMADALGVPVIAEFRQRDLAAGGEGAPLAPIYHYGLAKRAHLIPCVFVNLGGCCNVTIIPAVVGDLIAFDSGPGNGLLDRFLVFRTGEAMDRDGAHARRGRVDEIVLQALKEHSVVREGENYLWRRPPKSLDIRDFKLVAEIDRLSVDDGCATLAAFSAEAIALGLRPLLAENVRVPNDWIAAGGGAYNPVLLREIASRVGGVVGGEIRIRTADDAGWSNKAMEAELFAFLAVRTLRDLPITFPGTTGVREPLGGGTVYRPQSAG